MIQSILTNSATSNGAPAFSASTSYSTGEQLNIDEAIGASGVVPVNIGIPNVAKVFYMALTNSANPGAASGTLSIIFDSGTIPIILAPGDSIVLQGNGSAGPALSLLAAAPTCNILTVTETAGFPANLKGVYFMNP